jgi:hypothetical protein
LQLKRLTHTGSAGPNETIPEGTVGSDVVEMSEASNKAPNRNRRGRVRVSRGIVNMAARCGGYAVRPMVWPMLLHWDGCRWNRNNGMPTQQRITVEA